MLILQFEIISFCLPISLRPCTLPTRVNLPCSHRLSKNQVWTNEYPEILNLNCQLLRDYITFVTDLRYNQILLSLKATKNQATIRQDLRACPVSVVFVSFARSRKSQLDFIAVVYLLVLPVCNFNKG